MSKLLFVFIVGVALSMGNAAVVKVCQPFNNIQATLWAGSPKDPQVIRVNTREDLAEAYKVEIDNQNIPELCGLKDLPELDTLTIRNSKIRSIRPGTFDGTTNLRTLDLTHNEIHEIPAGLFNKLNIRRVNLTSNQISTIDPAAFDDLPRLQVVELADNHIAEITGRWFVNSPQVYRLVLDGNRIEKVPKDALKNLAASASRPHAVHLWLSNNRINEVHPMAFRHLDEIESLWMDHNRLSHLAADTFKGIKLGTFNIGDNRFTCFEDEFLANVDAKEFMIDVNPLECDCLRKLRKWSKKKGVEVAVVRRGLECLKVQIDTALKTQKQYYEEQLEMERRF